jgi:hypothetical protein
LAAFQAKDHYDDGAVSLPHKPIRRDRYRIWPYFLILLCRLRFHPDHFRTNLNPKSLLANGKDKARPGLGQQSRCLRRSSSCSAIDPEARAVERDRQDHGFIVRSLAAIRAEISRDN